MTLIEKLKGSAFEFVKYFVMFFFVCNKMMLRIVLLFVTFIIHKLLSCFVEVGISMDY